ncbi:uncharacterized protein LOC118429421 [Branchiostoma floridae]|uniref:Uncharacterized protein LOC118429421 n=1 Tax=Branchiostoma floridae TaxID=7739 RepID=A0A9J7M6M3_BRAFL|nr:uncharacterized protein LOC118429421 [Branchiostoma floridae]
MDNDGIVNSDYSSMFDDDIVRCVDSSLVIVSEAQSPDDGNNTAPVEGDSNFPRLPALPFRPSVQFFGHEAQADVVHSDSSRLCSVLAPGACPVLIAPVPHGLPTVIQPWPPSQCRLSVNSGIPTDAYYGVPFKLTLPRLDDFLDIVVAKGPACLMFKRDLRRYYRQIPVDPKDYALLGFTWRGLVFVDTSLPFGLSSSTFLAQRVSDAVNYVFHLDGYDAVNYIDDFGGADEPDRATDAYEHLGKLIQDLGLEESAQKAEPPSTYMTFVGVGVDSVRMIVEVTPQRLQEVSDILFQWQDRDTATRRDVESLIGKLMYIAKCVRSSRLFVSRLLRLLSTMPDRSHSYPLGEEFHKDLAWWVAFLRVYNGISIIPQEPWSVPDAVAATDSCLTGCGGICGNEYFHKEFPPAILQADNHIAYLETLTLVVAAKIWGPKWRGKRLQFLCDSADTVSVLNTGKAKDAGLLACARELWWIASREEFQIKVTHISGETNRQADHLSRWHLSLAHQDAFLQLTDTRVVHEIFVPDDFFTFLCPF